MFRCRVCFEEKSEDSFSYKDKAPALRHTQCKDCNRVYCAGHYQRNAKQHKERAVIISAIRQEGLHRRLFAYLAEHPCLDCGKADPLVLELDHRDNVEKLHNLSRMWYNAYP